VPTVANDNARMSAFTSDQHRAESLLAELATDLRWVPVDGRTRTLHLRALSLKREVMRWSEELPEESIRHSLLDEVVEMQAEARDWRRLAAGRKAED
jgi:hypothetical protein